MSRPIGLSPGVAHLIRAFPRQPAPAIILGLEMNGLGFLRSLGRRRIPLLALDGEREPAMFSRYCVPMTVPDPIEDESALLRTLQEIGEVLPVPGVLVPTSDAYTLFASKYSDVLSKHYNFNIPDYKTVGMLANKKLQYEYARRHGVEIPLTLYPADMPIQEIAREMDYPCIVKPSVSHLWRRYAARLGPAAGGKVTEVRSASELIATCQEMMKSGIEPMIQERIGGGEDLLYSLLTYLNRSSEPLAIFTKRKLRQYPREYGNSCFQVGVWEPEVADSGLRLLQGLGYRGNAGVEFKRDPKDGRLKLVEINPRSLATNYHATVSGVDVPYIAYRDSNGESVERAITFTEGVKWIRVSWDFKAFQAGRRAGELDFGRWLKSLSGRRCFAFFATDDPLPAVIGSAKFIHEEMQRIRAG